MFLFLEDSKTYAEPYNSIITRDSEFSSYEIELRNWVTQMTSHFELVTRKLLQEVFFRVNNSTS